MKWKLEIEDENKIRELNRKNYRSYIILFALTIFLASLNLLVFAYFSQEIKIYLGVAVLWLVYLYYLSLINIYRLKIKSLEYILDGNNLSVIINNQKTRVYKISDFRGVFDTVSGALRHNWIYYNDVYGLRNFFLIPFTAVYVREGYSHIYLGRSLRFFFKGVVIDLIVPNELKKDVEKYISDQIVNPYKKLRSMKSFHVYLSDANPSSKKRFK